MSAPDHAPALMVGRRALAHALVVSLVVAAVGLAVVILPWAYGIDPTGLGGALGLGRTPEPTEGPATSIVRTTPLLVGANRSIEIGQSAPANVSMSFSWASDQPLTVALEAVDANGVRHPMNITWTGNETRAATTFTTPFAGEYRIRFHNPGDVPADVILDVTAPDPRTRGIL